MQNFSILPDLVKLLLVPIVPNQKLENATTKVSGDITGILSF
jgi:hypothetical protein